MEDLPDLVRSRGILQVLENHPDPFKGNFKMSTWNENKKDAAFFLNRTSAKNIIFKHPPYPGQGVLQFVLQTRSS